MLHSRLDQSNHEPSSLDLIPTEPEMIEPGKEVGFGDPYPCGGCVNRCLGLADIRPSAK